MKAGAGRLLVNTCGTARSPIGEEASRRPISLGVMGGEDRNSFLSQKESLTFTSARTYFTIMRSWKVV